MKTYTHLNSTLDSWVAQASSDTLLHVIFKNVFAIFSQENGEPIEIKDSEIIMKIQGNVEEQIFERAQ